MKVYDKSKCSKGYIYFVDIYLIRLFPIAFTAFPISYGKLKYQSTASATEALFLHTMSINSILVLRLL